MTCRIKEETLFEYLDGELDELNVLVLEAYLKECASCRAKLQNLKSLDADLSNWAIDEPEWPKKLDSVGVKAYAKVTGKGAVLESFMKAQNVAWNAPFVFLDHMPGRKTATRVSKAVGKSMVRTSGALLKGGYKLATSKG